GFGSAGATGPESASYAPQICHFDDSRVLTGSYNWTRSAAEFNEENIIVSDDSRLQGLFSQHFKQLWDEVA
ncbi:MAG: phospholipase D-like domain-containing protein, partial [Pirellulaceae bacterium]